MAVKFNPFTHKFDFIESAGGPTGSINSLTGNSGGVVNGDNVGNVNLIGSGSLNVVGNPVTNTLTFSIAGEGFTWNVVTNATNPNTLVSENGYIPKGAGSVTFVLPATAAIGDTFKISGYGNLWTITQNAGQSITEGTTTTTMGISGSITATQVKDCATLLCVTSNTEFQIIDMIGNLSFI